MKKSILLLWIMLAGLLVQSCTTAPSQPPVAESTPLPTVSTTSATPISALQSTPSTTPTPTFESQIQVKPESLNGVTVQFWHTWSEEAESTLVELVSRFNEENEWGITVIPTNHGNLDDLAAAIDAAGKDNTLPDIAPGYLYQTLIWDANQTLVDLEPYVQDPTWGMSTEKQADFYPAFWQHDFVENKRLGIPAQRSAQVLFYNSSWAKELGFTQPPANAKDFSDQACAASKTKRQDRDLSNDSTGGWIVSTQYSAMLGWFNAFGSDIESANGSGYRLDSQEIAEAMRFLRNLYDMGCAWQPNSETPDGEFATRQGLFTSSSVLNIPKQAQTFYQANSQDEWRVLPFPSANGEPAINVYGPSFVVFQSSPEKQLASWLWIRWLTTSENQAKMIETTGALPLQKTTVELVQTRMPPQWQQAVQALDYAHAEPTRSSWQTVRWAVSDAAIQLFRYYFTIDQTPELVRLLQQTATDLDTPK